MRSAVDGVNGGRVKVAYWARLKVDVVPIECGQVLIVKTRALTAERVTRGQFVTDCRVDDLAAHVP